MKVKRLFLFMLTALIGCLYCLAGCGGDAPEAAAIPPAPDAAAQGACFETPGAPEGSAPLQTDAPVWTEAPEGTDGPEAALPPLPDIPEEELPLLTLVNFENPIYTEPPVVLISEALTAPNVTCDPRRHADGRAVKALDEMLLAAARDGEYHFVIASAFRTIKEQSILWNGRANQDPAYGSDPYNYPVSVMPKNCSEHTTGLAFDLLCDNCPHSDHSFIYTAEGRWLAQNAWKYGFVLRYPEDKSQLTGVQYEPWHYRYVGRTAAKYMYENGLCLEELVKLLGE